jgi:hypothetical protein
MHIKINLLQLSLIKFKKVLEFSDFNFVKLGQLINFAR